MVDIGGTTVAKLLIWLYAIMSEANTRDYVQ